MNGEGNRMDVTTEREALDALLAMFSWFDVLSVDWQRPDHTRSEPGPWLLVTLGQRSDDGTEAWAEHRFAIWKRTGAVHGIDVNGAVIDPALITGVGA
jgi:hypothetical protein